MAEKNYGDRGRRVCQEYLGNGQVGEPERRQLSCVRRGGDLRTLSLEEQEDIAWM